MGPVRGRLTAALAILPAPALAEVCDKVRPGWNLADGPVGILGEAMFVLSSFPGLVVLAFLAFGLARPNRWISIACGLPAIAFGVLLAVARGAGTAAQAITEGCLGNALPVALLLIALGALTILRGWTHR